MLTELKAQHRNICQLAFNGIKRQDIADQLEISPQTVSNVLNSPLGKAYLNGLSDKIRETTIDVRRELVSMNKDALVALKDLLTPKAKIPASVKLGAAKDILDRTGYKPTDKVNIDMTFSAKSEEEIDAEIAALEQSIKATNLTQSEEPLMLEESSSATELPSLDNQTSEDLLDDSSNRIQEDYSTLPDSIIYQPNSSGTDSNIESNSSLDPFADL